MSVMLAARSAHLEVPAPRVAAPAASAAPASPDQAGFTAAVYGLGGLGVMGLARLLCETLLLRFPRAASTETRGIAQRRAPVHALVRAGAAVYSATPPGAGVPVVVALEAGEALRAAPLMQPGALCLMCDLCLPASGRDGTPMRTAAEVRALLEARGVQVVTVPVQQWLAERRISEALTSSVALGALAALLELPLPACEALLARRTPPARREENLAAFRWGAANVGAGGRVAAARGAQPEAARPVPAQPAAAVAGLALSAA